jgi:hypothetical protein
MSNHHVDPILRSVLDALLVPAGTQHTLFAHLPVPPSVAPRMRLCGACDHGYMAGQSCDNCGGRGFVPERAP